MKKIISIISLAALTIGILGSCKKEEYPKVSVISVTLDQTALTLTVGDHDVKLTATVLPENATNKTVNWSSDKTDVATVDNQGKVCAIVPGTATITVSTTDGSKTATCTVTVLPVGAIQGVFSVSATKKVFFSKGNLYADGDKALHFESNQYSFASSWDASRVSHFTCSSTVEAAVGTSYSGDYLFCDEIHKVSVDGGEPIYYALTKDEWKYLFDNHSYKWVTVNSVNGYVIAPDGFNGELASSYADDAALAANNLVFLPAAGYRYGSYVGDVGVSGEYWPSSVLSEDDFAQRVIFSSDDVFTNTVGPRDSGYSVRLITESK